MLHPFNRQNDNASLSSMTLSDAPTLNTQRAPRWGRFLNAIFPCCSNRAVLASILDQEGMREAISRVSLENVSPVDTLEHRLLVWKNNAPDDESIYREIAAQRILDVVHHQGTYLNLSGFHLTSLPENLFQSIPSLSNIDCSFNRLSTLDYSNCNELTEIKCCFNQLIALEMSGCTSLAKLDCAGNQLTALNIHGLPQLLELDCTDNALAAISFNHCMNLKLLDCAMNALTSINLRNLHSLEYLSLSGNNALTELLLPEFNQETPNALRHLELSGTHIQWNDLPRQMREDQEIFIDIRPQHLINQNINNAQNTHTASIHRAASQNAIKLKNDNRDTHIDQAYESLSHWIQELSTETAAIENGAANDAFKNTAAKEWVQNPLHLDHMDEISSVTVQEFLARAWVAIHDETQRESSTTLDQAKSSLRDALYEMRRGYNLNEDIHYPKDNGEIASNICAGGTFNKISEKLVSVVKDMAFKLITRETFTASLQATIQQAVKKLIENSPHGDFTSSVLEENDGFLTESIWDQIKEPVKAAMDEEFGVDEIIAGKSVTQLFDESTDFDHVLSFLKINDALSL